MRLVQMVDFFYQEVEDRFIPLTEAEEGQSGKLVRLEFNTLLMLDNGKIAILHNSLGVDIDELLERGLIDQARWDRANGWAIHREDRSREESERKEREREQKEYLDQYFELTQQIRWTINKCLDNREKENLKRLLVRKEAFLEKLRILFRTEFGHWPN